MPANRLTLLIVLILTLPLVACGVFTPGQQAAPPPPIDMLAGPDLSSPTPPIEIQTGELGPAPTPADAAVVAGSAALGEVLFVRDGQIWATTIDTANERQLTQFEPGKALRSLALSPDARYLAFTIDAAAIGLLDLTGGTIRVLGADEPTIVSSLEWSPSANALFYARTNLDVETFAPLSSAVVRLDPLNGASVDLEEGVFSEGREVVPVAVLPGGRVVIAETNPLADSTVINYTLYDEGTLTPLDTSAAGTVALSDFSPDGSFGLFIDLADSSRLLLAPFDAVSAFTAAATIADLGDRVFRGAHVISGGSILALAGDRPILLQPAGGGEFTLVDLDAGEENVRTLSLTSHSADAVIAARLPADGGRTELYLVPTDGSAGVLLTVGEQPIAIVAR